MPRPATGHAAPPSRPPPVLRGIALFEGLKGLAALVVGVLVVQVVHHDWRHAVLEWLGHWRVNPADPIPAMLVQYAGLLNDTPLETLEWLLGLYLSLRFVEAYGLWRERAWAEWLGAVSWGVYVPFEWRHWWQAPNGFAAALLILNIVIVAYLLGQLWKRRTPRPGPWSDRDVGRRPG